MSGKTKNRLRNKLDIGSNTFVWHPITSIRDCLSKVAPETNGCLGWDRPNGGVVEQLLVEERL
jgi:hypothetical protein